MGCISGEWCAGCKKAKEIKEEQSFLEHKNKLNSNFVYEFRTSNGSFITGFVCYKAIEKQNNKNKKRCKYGKV